MELVDLAEVGLGGCVRRRPCRLFLTQCLFQLQRRAELPRWGQEAFLALRCLPLRKLEVADSALAHLVHLDHLATLQMLCMDFWVDISVEREAASKHGQASRIIRPPRRITQTRHR